MNASPFENLGLALRLALAATVSLFSFALCVSFANGVVFFAMRTWGPGTNEWATLGAYLFANALGLALAAGLGALASPFVLRQTFRTQPVGADTDLARDLWTVFAAAGVEGVQLEILERHGPRFHNAMVAGWAKSRIFPPMLFMTASVARGLSRVELKAVVAHEAAHLALGHLPGRFKAMAKATALAAVGVFVYFLVSLLWLPPVFVALGALVLPVMAALAPLRALSRVSRAQEFEADEFAVATLGADPDSLLTALKKIEAWSGRSPALRGAKSVGSHPLFAEREKNIAGLRQPESANVA